MSSYVIANRDTDYQAWLDARKRFVTASESSHLMGLGDKRWRLSSDQLAARKGTPIEDSPVMAAGRFWEDSIIQYFSACTGWAADESSALYGNTDFPFMAATPDALLHRYGPDSPEYQEVLAPYVRFLRYPDTDLQGEEAVAKCRELLRKQAVDGNGGVLMEVKNQESKRRSNWTKTAPPDYYACQVQHQLLVCGADAGLLVARVDANELYIHWIDRDELFQDLLAQACEAFAKEYLGHD